MALAVAERPDTPEHAAAVDRLHAAAAALSGLAARLHEPAGGWGRYRTPVRRLLLPLALAVGLAAGCSDQVEGSGEPGPAKTGAADSGQLAQPLRIVEVTDPAAASGGTCPDGQLEDSAKQMCYQPGAPVLTVNSVQQIKVQQSVSGPYELAVKLTALDEAVWSAYTAEHVGVTVAFVVDDEVVLAPTIQGRIPGEISISGNFTQAQLDDIYHRLVG